MAGDFQLLVLVVLVVVACVIIWSKNNNSIDGVQLIPPKLRGHITRDDHPSCDEMGEYLGAKCYGKCAYSDNKQQCQNMCEDKIENAIDKCKDILY